MSNIYEPPHGFVDLREYRLSQSDFKSFRRIQAFLFSQEKNKKYIKKFQPGQWWKLQQLSAEYQSALDACPKYNAELHI
jgi:hypothetical protein